MSNELILRLLISMSDLVIEGMKAIDKSSIDATEEERNDAIKRLTSTSDEVKKRLAAMEDN